MKGVNKVILVGQLGKDPEVKYTNNGKAMAKFSLATNERYKDSDGEWQDKTEWHNVVVWGKAAENVGEYLKKGSSVYIDGKLQTRSYDKDGEKKYITEINAFEVIFLNSKGGDKNDKGEPERSNSRSTNRPSTRPAPKPQEISDDDIPF